MHHPLILRGGKSSLTFLPPDFVKHRLMSAGVIYHTMFYLIHLRPGQVKAFLL